MRYPPPPCCPAATRVHNDCTVNSTRLFDLTREAETAAKPLNDSSPCNTTLSETEDFAPGAAAWQLDETYAWS